MTIQSETGQSAIEFVSVAEEERHGFFRVSARSHGHSLTNPDVFLESPAAS